MRFEVTFSGHPNVRSLHGNTIEVTRERALTVSGDCIVGVDASSGCDGVPEELKTALRNNSSRVCVELKVEGHTFKIHGRGSSRLALSHPDDMVLRTSGYTCPRTLAVGCDKAADSLPRGMVHALQRRDAVGTMVISVR